MDYITLFSGLQKNLSYSKLKAFQPTIIFLKFIGRCRKV